ncbi:hypothetical protein MNBD_GAMMA06-740 [hydrothermal vent metagenome]|uniref:Uncharacterized protein n=1 Tax=hydrothermal vent metagenome TaxID=652676 RepID=A0A3B0WLV6_9ZZZZ
MKPHKYNSNVLSAEDKFNKNRNVNTPPADFEQLGDLAVKLLGEKNLEISKVRPFFWSLVETYVDRFDYYPFDVSKALFSYLELKDYPEELVLQLVKQLEVEFESAHGRPLHKSAQLQCRQNTVDDEIKELRDCLKYAAMVAEVEE